MNRGKSGRVVDPRSSAVDEPDRDVVIDGCDAANHRVLGESEVLGYRSKTVFSANNRSSLLVYLEGFMLLFMWPYLGGKEFA